MPVPENSTVALDSESLLVRLVNAILNIFRRANGCSGL